VTAAQSLIDRIRHSAVNFGGSLNAATCYLLERSMKTLGIRVERQCSNAQYIAKKLQENVKIKQVHYPGLPDHPGHAVAMGQMRAFGAVVSFELDERSVDPSVFVRRLKLIKPAVSLGGIETIICSPAATSHAKLSKDERKSIGITDGLFRLSVGIEDRDDLLTDITTAF